MKIETYVYIWDTGAGIGARVFLVKEQALEALRIGYAKHGYEGVADEDAMSNWKDSNSLGFDTMFIDTQELDLTEHLKDRQAFLEMAKLRTPTVAKGADSDFCEEIGRALFRSSPS